MKKVRNGRTGPLSRSCSEGDVRVFVVPRGDATFSGLFSLSEGIFVGLDLNCVILPVELKRLIFRLSFSSRSWPLGESLLWRCDSGDDVSIGLRSEGCVMLDLLGDFVYLLRIASFKGGVEVVVLTRVGEENDGLSSPLKTGDRLNSDDECRTAAVRPLCELSEFEGVDGESEEVEPPESLRLILRFTSNGCSSFIRSIFGVYY
jgi:hypothetical protein